MSEPIGHVTWGAACRAELLTRDTWRVTIGGVEQPDMARAFGDLYRDAYKGPSDGFYGYGILEDLARLMDGTFVFHQPPKAAPGVVY